MNLHDAADLAWIAQPRRLRQLLETYFGELDDDTAARIAAQCTAVDIRGGEMLFAEGDPGDALFFLLSGRMRALAAALDGARRVLGDIEPGTPVGEMAVIKDSVRSATVVATRDCTLLRIEAQQVRAWFMLYPQILLKTARLAIDRAQKTERRRRRRDNVVNLALLPISPGIDMAAFRSELQTGLAALGRTLVLDAATVRELGGPALFEAIDSDSVDAYRRLTHWLDNLELDHEFVVYCSTGDDGAWTRRCVRQADRVLLVADGTASSAVSSIEAQLGDALATRLGPGTMLALWHDPETIHPVGTRAWLNKRPWVAEHVHVRRGQPEHALRLARIVTGNAVGLVLGSGGARGMAHIGVYQALQESGVGIDRIGGTSIGSVIAASIACDLSAADVVELGRNSFSSNPGGWRDLSIPPVFAIYRGKRLERLLASFFPESMGIEDLWINFFCISSDLTYSREIVHTHGSVRRILRASVALPGIFPPVKIDQALHVDGAFMNALPVDVMGAKGVNRIYAVDLSFERVPRFDFHEVPGPLAFLFDKWFKRRKRRYRIPTMTNSLVQSSLIASEAKLAQSRRQVDVLFNPDVRKFDLMGWSDDIFARLVALGHKHGLEVLARAASQAGQGKSLNVRRRRAD